MASLGAVATGCVVPLPYPDESTDAAVGGYPPVIRAGTPPLGEPTTISRAAEPPTFTLDVEDRDIDDTIYLRVFRNYNPDDPTPQLRDSPYPPGGEALRTLEVSTIAWCPESAGDLDKAIFEVVVADRPFDTNPTPPLYRAVTGGGDFTIRPWIISCAP